jgi:hypothetical protein
MENINVPMSIESKEEKGMYLLSSEKEGKGLNELEVELSDTSRK